MPDPVPRSLRRVLLGHELAFLVLVAVTGAIGGAWAYFWQQTSAESLRLNAQHATAQDIRTLLFRQVQEAAIARLRDVPSAQRVYANYYDDIQTHFNALRQRSASRAEDYAIQALQEAYSQVQATLVEVLDDAYLSNRLARGKLLDPGYADSLVHGFEHAFENLIGLLSQALTSQSARVHAWIRYAPFIVPVPLLIACALLLASRASLTRGFVRPIQALLRDTQRISAGELDIRVPTEGVAEILDLARGINQMAQDLASQREALVEAERQAALGALVPVVAHNVRNPLAGIRASAQLLPHADSAVEVAEIGHGIIESVDRLGRWISALVSYLHPLQPQLSAQPAVRILEAVLEMLKPRLAEKQLRVVYGQWDSAAMVMVDSDLMEQALYGVFANALEASPVAAPLTLAVSREREGVVMSIEDRAGGIPFLPRPSDLTPGPTTKRFGTGLGIPIAFKVCKAHGWTLAFQVIDNRGTRVTITAPAEELSA